jgi:hypothetical protein
MRIVFEGHQCRWRALWPDLFNRLDFRRRVVQHRGIPQEVPDALLVEFRFAADEIGTLKQGNVMGEPGFHLINLSGAKNYRIRVSLAFCSAQTDTGASAILRDALDTCLFESVRYTSTAATER